MRARALATALSVTLLVTSRQVEGQASASVQVTAMVVEAHQSASMSVTRPPVARWIDNANRQVAAREVAASVQLSSESSIAVSADLSSPLYAQGLRVEVSAGAGRYVSLPSDGSSVRLPRGTQLVYRLDGLGRDELAHIQTVPVRLQLTDDGAGS